MSDDEIVIDPAFPREFEAGVFWTGGCMVFGSGDAQIHSHMCTYVVVGADASLIVDTGHPAHWEKVSADLDAILGDRPLDYIFPSHTEYPHAGNVARLLEKYPQARVVGDTRDYHLFYPRFAGRLEPRGVGEKIELGGRDFVVLPALLRDLPNTVWGYDTRSRTMFVSDGFCYLHDHRSGECALLSTERSVPSERQIAWFNERALFWTRYVGPQKAFREIEKLFATYPPAMLAPAHGSVITNIDEMTQLIYEGMVTTLAERENRPVVGYSA
ncbi:MBL fold metallo-hydrolase [Pseudonocardia sp.]|uniref:MBL fold metallo-hydrolase n=1 Tax=Pseudonocardia sp. TaxID=60912 RepID=UPI003D0A2908